MGRSGEDGPGGGNSRCKGLEAGIGLGGLRSTCRVGGGFAGRDELREVGSFSSTSFYPFQRTGGRRETLGWDCIWPFPRISTSLRPYSHPVGEIPAFSLTGERWRKRDSAHVPLGKSDRPVLGRPVLMALEAVLGTCWETWSGLKDRACTRPGCGYGGVGQAGRGHPRDGVSGQHKARV